VKGSAQRKAPGGLKRAILTRADEPLIRLLAKVRAARSKATGATLSAADIVRALIKEEAERLGVR
jgi:hypothetical protein